MIGLLGSSVPNFPTEDPIVFVFLTFFLKLKNLRHGATTFSDIFIDKKEYQNLLSRTFLLMKSLPFGRYIRLSVFKKWFCPPFFLKMIRGRTLKFSGIIYYWIPRADQVKSWSSVTSGTLKQHFRIFCFKKLKRLQIFSSEYILNWSNFNMKRSFVISGRHRKWSKI